MAQELLCTNNIAYTKNTEREMIMTMLQSESNNLKWSDKDGLLNRSEVFPPLRFQKGPYLANAFTTLTPKTCIDTITSFYTKYRFAPEHRDEHIYQEIIKAYERIASFFKLPKHYIRNFVITDSCSSAISTVAFGVAFNKYSGPVQNEYSIQAKDFHKCSSLIDRHKKMTKSFNKYTFSKKTANILSMCESVLQGQESNSVENLLALNNVSSEIIRRRPNIVISELEYMANVAAWVRRCERDNLELRIIPISYGGIDIAKAKQIIDPETLIVSVSLVSNYFGWKNNLSQIIRHAKKMKALVNVDAAQALFQTEINLEELDADFVCFSGHKALGPAGVGLIYINPKAYCQISPILIGDAGTYFNNGRLSYRDDVTKFWSGVTATDKIIAFSRSFTFVHEIGQKNVEQYNQRLIHYFRNEIRKLDYLFLPNRDYDLYGLCSFIPKYGIGSIEVQNAFASEAISTTGLKRQEFPYLPEIYHLNSEVIPRVSVHLYNTKDDVDKCVALLKKVKMSLM